MLDQQNMIIPIILSGGPGTRLWPLSRQSSPKPFIKLKSGYSLLYYAFQRAAAIPGVQHILSVTNKDYHLQTLEEIASLPLASPIQIDYLLEPASHNTAAAIALASLYAQEKFSADQTLLVLPADHIIHNVDAFTDAVLLAARAAQQGKIVTFGIKPTHPDTNFGYIEIARAASDPEHAHTYLIKQFREKPDLHTAEKYIQNPDFFWNSGMFCFQASTLLAELKSQNITLYNEIINCWQKTEKKNSPVYLKNNTFAKITPISIDYAVMEKAKNLCMVAGNFAWDDVGTWRALNPQVLEKKDANYSHGETLSHDSENCHIHSHSRLVATVGVKDLTIVDTQDALLIAHNEHLEKVPHVVNHLIASKHKAYFYNRTVCRPWGSYTVLEEGVGFKIKRILVKPGGTLSLQMHYHRNEHWIVVSGTATVMVEGQEKLIHTNQSSYIPAGIQHRLSNAGKIDLILIEVQTGQYLEEDDIIRLDDTYNRESSFS